MIPVLNAQVHADQEARGDEGRGLIADV